MDRKRIKGETMARGAKRCSINPVASDGKSLYEVVRVKKNRDIHKKEEKRNQGGTAAGPKERTE